MPPLTTPDVMRVPIKGTSRVIELDATRNAAGEVAAVALFQLVQSISGLSRTQTDDVIKELKVSKPHLMQFVAYNGSRRTITVEGARRLIQDIGNGPFNPKRLPYYKTDRSKAVHTVALLRAGVLDVFEGAIKRMNGSRVDEVSDAASTGASEESDIEAYLESDEDLNTVPTRFWTDLAQTQSAAYEGAVERFFRHPHIEAVYARMAAFEQDEMQSELAFMCDAFTQGFQPLGYVYVAWNALFGHLLKIGFTMRTPALRLRELSGAGVPEPFELVAYVQSPNPFALEQSIHSHFAEVRKYGRRKEFFTLTREAAIAYFKTLGGHDAAERPPPAAPSKKRKAP